MKNILTIAAFLFSLNAIGQQVDSVKNDPGGYNIFVGHNVALDEIGSKYSIVIGDNKRVHDKKMYMVWDIDYNYLQKHYPDLISIIKSYDSIFKENDSDDQGKEFIIFLQSLFRRLK